MTLWPGILFFSVFLFLVQGIFVFFRVSRRSLGWAFSLLCLAAAVRSSGFGFALFPVLPFKEFSADFFRIGYAGLFFLPTAYYHFSWKIAGSEKDRLFVGLAYAAAGFFILNLWPGFDLIHGSSSDAWGTFPQAGGMFPLFLVFSAVLLLRAFALFSGLRKSSKGIACARLRYFFVSLLLLLFSFADVATAYGRNFPPAGSLFLLLSLGSAAYAITAYRPVSADFIVKKTFLLTLLLALLIGGGAGAVLFTGKCLSGLNLPISEYWIYGVFIFGVVLFYDPLRGWLIRMTDRYLFQKKYESERILRDASRGMTQIESLDRLVKLVVYFSTMRMRVANAAVLLWEEKTRSYRVVCRRGYRAGGEEARGKVEFVDRMAISIEHPLIQYLSREHGVLEMERTREFLLTGRGPGKGRREPLPAYDFQEILRRMEELRAVCVIPSFLGKQLRSVLCLGEKKSGECYSDRDLDVLYTLAQESSIAVENARLCDEAMSKTKEIERINQEHAEASRKLRSALEETEEANKKLRDAQAQLIHEQKMATLGRLAASVGHEVNNPLTILSMNISRMILKYRKDPSLRVADIADFFEKMESNIQRIKAVVNTLTGLLKKSEKGKFEPLSLKLVIEETLPLVQFQTYLDNLSGTDVEFSIPGNLPLIHGNLERLQEVFLNLFTNAYHALSIERNDRRIQISAYVNESDPKHIHVDFSDNGSGIDDETVKKIFNYGYTTKGEGKGSGIGLYMCRYIIELHGGEIKVKSKKGEGTTFTLTLPVYEEGAKSDLRDFSKTAKS